MFLLVARDENIVFIFPLFSGPVLEHSDSVAVLPVVEPLSLVLEAVGSFAGAEPTSLVVLPLAHVGLRYAGVKQLVLE